ncbi:AraC family transcriptional regulator [Dyadobacter sp. Leaf189]|uniref:helix-turn-helix domain-containing protein n=1 Tax=Dyadobacter sp. Leaf189 TaxID=1736295 RepID=UPI000701960D|nr:helix-turn-helix transcriptional regulator [Dyadobacter sp. Leaf189]KQS27876.1 AraC family transcriptional regulator [Dyadobacter sp. Leaf189]
MKKSDLLRFRSISSIHQALGLPKPQHPLISLTHFNENNQFPMGRAPVYDVLDFYKIKFNAQNSGRLKYGQHYYDFEEGSMMFMAPQQLVGAADDQAGGESYVLLIHPDFLLGYPLAQKIRQYSYFSYSVNEALHLSDQEKEIVLSIYHIIERELNSRVDEFSQEIVVAQLELLLSYASRFYKRQFVTRRATCNTILERTECVINDYLNNQKALDNGLPTVQYLSEQLNVSSGYLSDILRSLIGQNAQQYIHEKLVEKAKERLSTTDLTVSAIGYELGFEHSQSFNKFFKNKTRQSPLEFRQSFMNV